MEESVVSADPISAQPSSEIAKGGDTRAPAQPSEARQLLEQARRLLFEAQRDFFGRMAAGTEPSVQERKEQLSPALALIDEAAALGEEKALVLLARSRYWVLVGEHVKGGQACEDGLRLRQQSAPLRAEEYAGLGGCLELQDRPLAAIAAFQQALKLDPQHQGAHLALPMLLKRAGRRHEAIAAYRAAADTFDRAGNRRLADLMRLGLGLAESPDDRSKMSRREYAQSYNDSCERLAASHGRPPTYGYRMSTSRSKEGIRATIEGRREGIAECYESALAGWPQAEGTVVMRLDVLPDGSVGEIELIENSTPVDTLPCCMFEEIEEWDFGSAPGMTKVTYPWVFQQR